MPEVDFDNPLDPGRPGSPEAGLMHMLHSLDTPVGGLATTVRRGTKWANSGGTRIDLCVCLPTPNDHHIAGQGVIASTWTGPFEEIPGRFLQYEHELESRTYQGLLDSMRRAYGPTFTESEEVTVVMYRRTE